MNLTKFIWPWQSNVLIENPWVLSVFFLLMSIPLAIVSWKRMKKKS